MNIPQNITNASFENNSSVHLDFVLDDRMLNNAIIYNQISLYYQPQIDLHTGQVVGLQGLLRWVHPRLGVKLPQAFIPTAEQTGAIERLTDLAIDSGFKFMQTLSQELSFSLNISSKCIQNHHLVDSLSSSCQKCHISPTRVILEFTDASTLEKNSYSKKVLNELKIGGFRLGIDDLDMKYSSKLHSEKVPFTEIKIDRTLIETMVISPKSRKSILATIQFAKNLGIKTIAEGIENNLEAIGLRELGCQRGQGYYFARPMSQQDTLTWLEGWNKHSIKS